MRWCIAHRVRHRGRDRVQNCDRDDADRVWVGDDPVKPGLIASLVRPGAEHGSVGGCDHARSRRMLWVRYPSGTAAHVSSNADFMIEMVSASKYALQRRTPAIRRWLDGMGRERYQKVRALTITPTAAARMERGSGCGGRTAKTRRRNGPRAPRSSLSAGRIEVE
jgi:hypothetical protein